MHNKLLITCLVIFLCTNASAQKSAEDYIKELEAAGYSEIQPLSFAITKTNYALTGLFKGKADKTRLMFSAEISSDKDGANLFFRAYRKCTLSNKDVRRLDERIIVVHGQKIEAYYFCGAGQDGQTNEIYKIKSVAGRACPRFCVNGLMAGNCLHLQRKRNDRKQRTDRPPVGGLQKT